MVRSMTGFGRAESQKDGRRIAIEIRSVNHRYFDFGARLPNSLSALESRIRDRVREVIARGKVHVAAQFEDADPHVSLRINDQVAERYLQIAQEIKTRFGLRGDLATESFLGMPDVLTREVTELEEEAAWLLIAEPLEVALTEFQARRTQEGEAMTRDLSQRLEAIAAAVDRIEKRIPEVLDQVRRRLHERITQISNDTEYNQTRLEAEVTLFADRTDVTEECVRLRSHLEQFSGCITVPEPAGRRFNFLLQEMNREVNTIGSKSQDLGISQDVILAKEEIEKIREQVQNVE